jgi:hypothetical protein
LRGKGRERLKFQSIKNIFLVGKRREGEMG